MMKNIIDTIRNDFKHLNFVEDEIFFWSPKNQEVHYRKNSSSEADVWRLLHEIGHAVLDHKRFNLDINLLHLEIAAWEEAKKNAERYGMIISEDHIQDCLDTYRDWLYKRSICPDCLNTSLQNTSNSYSCFNCNNSWKVSASRTCRTYRKKQKASAVEAF
jgi:hypothetical protein